MWTAMCSSIAPAGIAVNSTGHAHPDVVRAITTQAQKYLHMSGTDFYYEPQVALAEEIASIVPVGGGSRESDRFFSNSGTEAIEAAIKLRALHQQTVQSHCIPGLVSRPHARCVVRHVEQVRPAPGLRPNDARVCSTRRMRTAIAARSG
jgi:4-aminobutyrate aminotransferase-like enzyme